MSTLSRILFFGWPLAASLGAGAQTAQGAPPPQLAPGYSSAFDGYRPFAAEEIQDWRRSNDTVRDIGGWRAYAREIHGTSAPPSSADKPGQATAAKPKASDPHAGHRK
jgi:hypothetical protein